MKLDAYNSKQQERISAAQDFATAAHRGQLRKSGEDFISHPLAVAQTLVEWRMDAETIMAGLLHDVVEDTPVSLAEVEKEFGAEVASLVDGVTKLGQVDFVPIESAATQRQEASYENLRKLLLAMSKDLRVITIKLADRLHNMRTLKFLPAEDQLRVAQETLEIYAPLADRLGMGELKAQLEDLGFEYALPAEYKETMQRTAGAIKRAQRYIGRLTRFIERQLAAANVEVLAIEGRQKHLYSIYKKLVKVEGDLDKIYDLVAVRIIVPEVADCYKAMGLLHQDFKPLIYRIKDYIAVPKPNGYRSLHTTVFALDGRITEIQIRTPQMHEEAERGLAAHFFYASQKDSKQYRRREVGDVPAKLRWVNSLTELRDTTAGEFEEAVKVELFEGRIFIFSPKGDLYDLPEGATPLDFAFAVHTDIGLHTRGAKVNGKMVPLSHVLENRDVVEILTQKNSTPKQDWLKLVKTPAAKQRIRAWLRAKGDLPR